MQPLNIPPPRRPVVERSTSSSDLVFSLSTAPSQENLAETESPPATSNEQQDTPVNEEDRPDFGLTHAAPPDTSATIQSGSEERTHAEETTQLEERTRAVEQPVNTNTKG